MDFINPEILAMVFGAILAAKAAAMVVVNYTDTPTDDVWVGRFYKVVEALAGIVNSRKAKQLPGEGDLDG